MISDAEWYCCRDPEEERFYEIFFQICRKVSRELDKCGRKRTAVCRGSDQSNI